MPSLRMLWVASLLVSATPAATATVVYKCTGSNGGVVYQDEPCAKTQRQQPIHLIDRQPVVPPAPEAASPEAPPAPPPPTPAAPTAPLPVMFSCLRATDGSSYLSDRGDPPPYQVPFGILGALATPLGDAYGHGGGASAPELNRGKVTRGLVARHYVWVQDQCRQLDPQETCQALQDAYDKNEHQLQQAFKSDQAPFEKREAELQAQLTHC